MAQSPKVPPETFPNTPSCTTGWGTIGGELILLEKEGGLKQITQEIKVHLTGKSEKYWSSHSTNV